MKRGYSLVVLLLIAANVFSQQSPASQVESSSTGSSATTVVELTKESEIIVKAINPFYNRITLSASAEMRNVTIALYDCRGRQLRVWFDLDFYKDEMIDLDVQELPTGFYFLHLSSSQVIQSIKLIHQL